MRLNRWAVAGVASAAALMLSPTAHATPDGLDLTSHSVVRSSTLPHCIGETNEGDAQHPDGAPQPCTWNVGQQTDGNGIGLAYWIGVHNRYHYVWASSPKRPGNQWVTRYMAHSIAQHHCRKAGCMGGRTASYWMSCIWRTGDGRDVFVCRDGRRYVQRWI